MNIRERFAANYLRADDIVKPIVVTIASVTEASIGDDERIVLDFSDHQKLLPLNKTNALALADALGDDTDEWVGHSIELYTERVMFQGKRILGLRVRMPKAGAGKQQAQPKPQPQPKGSA